MLTKGIVEKLIDSYRIKVRIPVYNKPSYVNGATITNDLYEACICTLPNCSMNLQVGDIVILGFEDNDIAQPIILGCLYAKDINDSKTDLVVNSIEALNSVNLPKNTHIGNVTPTDLEYLTGLKSNVQGQLTGIIDNKVDKVTKANILYGTDSNGAPYAYTQTSTTATRYTVPLRDASGCIKVGTPVNKNDAATKDYVDKRADFVIEQGTSSNWTYRKWNSGILEQWGRFESTAGGWTAQGSIYETENAINTAYTISFIEPPVVSATLIVNRHTGWLSVFGGLADYYKSNTPSFHWYTHRSDLPEYEKWGVDIHATGKWKN